MNKKTFSVTFFLRKARTSKSGLAPILARITTSGLSKEVYIQCSAAPEKWSQDKERATGKDKLSYQVNAFLDDYRAKIIEIQRELTSKGYEGNATEIKSRLQNAGNLSYMFLSELEKYRNKRQAEVGVRITQLTANKYDRIFRYLKEYVTVHYQKEDIPLGGLDYEFIDGFNTFLQTAHNCKNNGAVNLLCCLKNFILYAIRNEWIEKNPFQHYKLKEEHNKDKDHLTKTEMDLLIAKQMPNERLERVRDVFVFCCFTGLAFADAEHLRAEHISKDEEGVSWIHKPREKTAVMSRIPLLPYPLKMLAKYKNASLEKGKLIPVPTNQRMNAYLKEIADISNIDKNLTTHCARHTFACLAIEYGMPIDVLAKILGHTNVNMTRHYAKISEKNIGKEMKKLSEVLEKGA